MDNQKEKELLDKYLAGLCTPQEQQAVESWYLTYAEKKSDKLNEPDYQTTDQEIWDAINQQTKPKVRFLRTSVLTAAAALLFIMMGAILFCTSSLSSKSLKLKPMMLHREVIKPYLL